METKSPTTTDDIRWLMENKDQLFLFVKIVKVGITKEIDDIQIEKLLSRKLIKSDQFGVRISERGVECIEALEALEYLNEI